MNPETFPHPPAPQPNWTAFQGDQCLRTGAPAEVAAAVKTALSAGHAAPVLVFDDATGRVVDADWRTGPEAVPAVQPAAAPPDGDGEGGSSPGARGRGRPRMGVVPREVTLLPRHWAWLGEQPGGASVALRKLVDTARAANAAADGRRRALEAAHHFMTAMAGNLADYEEALRALYAGNSPQFTARTASWPPDIRRHVLRLAEKGFGG